MVRVVTARRILITQERIVQVDDANELKCGARCQFYHHAVVSSHPAWCTLEDRLVVMDSGSRTEACTNGEVKP
jgi:hypothetical protein